MSRQLTAGVLGRRKKVINDTFLRFFNDSGNSYVSFQNTGDGIIYPDKQNEFSLIIECYPLDVNTGYILATGGQTASAGIAIIKNGSIGFIFMIKSGNLDGQDVYDFNNDNILINNWNTIKVEWVKNTYASITVNGITVTNNSPSSGSYANSSRAFALGVPDNRPDLANFNGYIKNFKVWNDIAKTDVWGDWPMLEGSGCEVIDKSGVNTNGILMPDCPTTSPIWEKII